MARLTHVPKFGNWDVNDNVPLTKVFESARAGKGQKFINPNDPAENPEAFGGRIPKDRPSYKPPVQKINSLRASEDRKSDTENEEMAAPVHNQQTEASGHRSLGETMQNRMGTEFKYQNRQGYLGVAPKTIKEDAPRRNPYPGIVPENTNSESEFPDGQSIYESPSPAYLSSIGNQPGSTSPGWEKEVPAERGTTYCSKPDETPDGSSPLPQFGAWYDKGPISGEGFTVIFNNTRNEKKTGGPVGIPHLQSESPGFVDCAVGQKQPSSIVSQHKPPSMWRCCFCGLSSSD